jgi:hypothetical protein
MSFAFSSTDPLVALREFCATLARLHKEAGGPSVPALHVDKTVPLRRAQIYATFGGTIKKPPAWPVVKALAERCVAYAADRGAALSVSTDLRAWEGEHRRLEQLWEPRTQAQRSIDTVAGRQGKAPGQVLTVQEIIYYRVPDGTRRRRIGIVTGGIREVRCANVWVNSENTEMEMARVHEFSISAIIRYEGATWDARGRVAEDLIADELAAKVAGHRPVEPGSVVVTGAGQLWTRNGVRHVIHAAAVRGEPGSGFQPMIEIGRCVGNAMRAAEFLDLPDAEPVRILFPLLGTGTAGGNLTRTAETLVHGALNYLRTVETSRIETVLFLAYTDLERKACERALRTAGLRSEP